jgi:two-component system LytT family response regulator
MTMKLLIVDEERHERTALVRLCERNQDVRVVGEAESGSAGIDAAEKFRPDVMLVDVELPDMTGFEPLRVARAKRRPLGIMVTTRADHAVTAFAEGALDYLVKPVSADRFAASIERARQRFDSARSRTEPAQSVERQAVHANGFGAAPFKILIGEREHRLYPLNAEGIDYIESDGNYVTIRSGSSKYISRDTIKRLSADVGDLGFIRIERSLSSTFAPSSSSSRSAEARSRSPGPRDPACVRGFNPRCPGPRESGHLPDRDQGAGVGKIPRWLPPSTA